MLTIYKASAGSGKTFTLAYEYIKTLLGVKLESGRYCLNADKYVPGGHRRAHRHRRIMALTFTNAATDEMKRRIVGQIANLKSPEKFHDSDYGKPLVETYGCTVEELQQAASLALSELLCDYGNFYVSTIDSFFQNVLRTFSREVDQQGDYELAIDSHDVVNQSISLMLDELNYAPHPNSRRLIDWISDFTIDKVRSGKNFNFFEREGTLIGTLAKNMERSMDETFATHSKALREYLADETRINKFETALRKKIEHVYDRSIQLGHDIEAGIAAAGLPSDVFGALHSRIAALSMPKPVFTSADFKLKAFQPGHSDEDILGRKYKKCIGAPGMSHVLDLAREFCIEFPRAWQRCKIYIQLLESLGTLDFIGMALVSLEKFLRDSNTVMINDTGELLRRIISDAEMPFIYERLGMKLETLLIDEFQDTSRLQWENLKPLVANSIAEGYDNLIIGDEKQSIYRFRNSDSELLGNRVQNSDFPHDSVVRGNRPEENTNWRSSGDIVRFNNSLFYRLKDALGAPYYDNVVQTPSKKFDSQPGYVRLHFHTSKDGPDDEVIFEQMAQDILRQHDAGYRWSDILVLCRRRDEATDIVKFLIENHPEIQVLSSEALLLRNSAAVRSIMSMLRLISRSYQSRDLARPDDAPAYASHADVVMMITRYNHYESEGLAPGDALDMALREGAEASGMLKDQINNIRAENPANLVALIEAIITHKLSPAQREAEYAYIAALVDLAVKQVESPEPSLADFIAAYDRNIEKWAIKASSDLDAVEVMTVHKSKGLERACVHIPLADWDLCHAKPVLWVPMDKFGEFDPQITPPMLRLEVPLGSPLRDRDVSPVADFLEHERRNEMIDNLNTTYVAFTRAARELIIHSRTEKVGKSIYDILTLAATGEKPAHTIDLADGFDSLTETYTLGAPTKPEKKYTPPKGQVRAGEYSVVYRSDTRELVSIDDALAVHLDIGDEEDKEITDGYEPFEATPEMREAARRGKNLHAILATMRTVDDLDRALNWQCARENVPAEESEEYKRTLIEAIADGGDKVADWFAPTHKVYAERSIFVPSIGKSLRPDRVVVRPDGSVVVVDYKFTSQTHKSHYEQVCRYVELLHGLGRPSVEGYIWYPVMKKIIKV